MLDLLAYIIMISNKESGSIMMIRNKKLICLLTINELFWKWREQRSRSISKLRYRLVLEAGWSVTRGQVQLSFFHAGQSPDFITRSNEINIVLVSTFTQQSTVKQVQREGLPETTRKLPDPVTGAKRLQTTAKQKDLRGTSIERRVASSS